jgi:GNAT superfamily N-acetyltransferase
MTVTTYLEITNAAALRPARPPRRPVELVQARDPAVNRDLYARVGSRWSWTDRLGWSDATWAAWAGRVETWVASVDGQVSGYCELDVQPDGAVEIASFGLLPQFHGLGAGGHLLTRSLARGLELGSRVWVHTCTRDGPGALPNYLARGMRIYRVEREP